MTRETLSKIRDINGRIRATAELLAEHGDIRNESGKTLATTITDLFTLLREVEAQANDAFIKYKTSAHIDKCQVFVIDSQ